MMLAGTTLRPRSARPELKVPGLVSDAVHGSLGLASSWSVKFLVHSAKGSFALLRLGHAPSSSFLIPRYQQRGLCSGCPRPETETTALVSGVRAYVRTTNIPSCPGSPGSILGEPIIGPLVIVMGGSRARASSAAPPPRAGDTATAQRESFLPRARLDVRIPVRTQLAPYIQLGFWL